MARGGLDFQGIGFRSSTWKANSGLVSAVDGARGWNDDGRDEVVGKAVTITDGAEAGYGSNGDHVLGRIDAYEFDENITVQDGGYTELPGVSGNLPNPGNFLVVNGSGAVVSGSSGTARAVSVDSENQTVMVLLG